MALATTLAAVADKRQYLRDERFKALRFQWRHTTIKSVRTCNHHSILPGGVVKVQVTPTPAGPRAGFSGLATCGNVWSCPVCSHKISTRRSVEIAEALRAGHAAGFDVAMVTLTMRHDKTQKLSELWDSLAYAWQAVVGTYWQGETVEDFQIRNSDWWERAQLHAAGRGRSPQGFKAGKFPKRLVGDRETFGIPGYIRAVEVTKGDNGWHVHVHALVMMEPADDATMGLLASRMFDRWSAALVRKGLDAPIMGSGGLHHRRIDLDECEVMGSYFSKATFDGALAAGFEAARGGQKTGRKGGRTPFQILLNVCENLDNADSPELQKAAVRDKRMWHVFEQASLGRRQITWSHGLKDLLGLSADEQTDEEIAAEDMTTDQTVDHVHYVNSTFKVVRRDLSGALRRAEIWYAEEYLPMVEANPDFARLWKRSFDEGYVDSLATALRDSGIN